VQSGRIWSDFWIDPTFRLQALRKSWVGQIRPVWGKLIRQTAQLLGRSVRILTGEPSKTGFLVLDVRISFRFLGFWVQNFRIFGFPGQNLQLLLDLLINLSIFGPEFTKIYQNLSKFLEFLKTGKSKFFLYLFR